MRSLLVVLALAGCKKEAPAPEPAPAPPPAHRTPPDATVAAAHAELPGPGGPAVTGELGGLRFSPAKVFLKIGPVQSTLELYAKSTGDPCGPELSLQPDDLYLSIDLPSAKAIVGATLSSVDDAPNFTDRVSVTYKTKVPFARTEREITVGFDELTATRARGRLVFSADDHSHASGRFDALICGSPQHAVATPPKLLGLAWQATVSPAALPHQPLAAIYLGSAVTPVSVEIVDWTADRVAQHEIHIFTSPPAQPCLAAQISPGFIFGLGKPIATGLAVTATTQSGSSPFASVVWQESSKVIGSEETGGISVVIDSARGDSVTGRVFGWFADPAKSMVAGAFTARRCKIDP